MFPHLQRLTHRSIARLLSSAICSTLVLVRPWSRYGGTEAFLAFTVMELVFSVQDTLAQQLEFTILHILGGALGIICSAIGKYLSTLPPHGTAVYAIPAIFLAFIAFLAGWIKSKLPRLTLSMRIACFISIWMLTSNTSVVIEIKHWSWILGTAAATSLFSSVLILQWSSPQLSRDVASAFSTLYLCLKDNLDAVQSREPLKEPQLRTVLLTQSASLSSTYHQAAFELRVGRVNGEPVSQYQYPQSPIGLVKDIKPLIGTIEHMRRELVWGMPPTMFLGKEDDRVLNCAAQDLGRTILQSLSTMEMIILECFSSISKSNQCSVLHERLGSLQIRLDNCTALTKKLLVERFSSPETECVDDGRPLRANTNNTFLFFTSLLQMVSNVKHSLSICDSIVLSYETAPLRLWHPRFSRGWLGVGQNNVMLDERGVLDADSEDVPNGLSEQEEAEGLAECLDPPGYLKKSSSSSNNARSRFGRNTILGLWNASLSMKFRLLLSRTIKSMRRSPHIKHGLKNAGVVLLGIPAFLPTTSVWFQASRLQWMLISYVWVLETNSGATWRVAYLRLSGTLLGAVYAYVASLICKTNPYGMAAVTIVTEIPLTWIIVNSSVPSLGVVASVTLPPIIYTPYFHPDPPITSLSLAVVRSLLISAGIVAALLANSLIYPRHCRVMFLSSACLTLGMLTQLYMKLSENLFQPSQLQPMRYKRAALQLELQIRNALQRMSILLNTMGDELSLVPKPIQRYRQAIEVLQQILDLLSGLRKIREGIPRKETVLSVFRARQPLPQYLPSARQTLGVLFEGIHGQLSQPRTLAMKSMDLSLMYAYAEMQVMEELVRSTERLLQVTRQLFGTASWFREETDNPQSNVTIQKF